MSDARVAVTSLLEAFGVPVTVMRPAPEDFPIATTGAWEALPMGEERPVGGDFQKREPRRVMTLSRADVPTIPRGTMVLAPVSQGASDLTWLVDGFDRVESDSWRVVLTRAKD